MRGERLGGDARSDEALLGAIALGDEQAGIAFVRRYQRRVYGLAFSILRERSSAEDVAQEALIRAWTHAAVYDSRRGTAAAWLLTITRNLAVDSLRLKRWTTLDTEGFAHLEMASLDHGPEASAEAGEDRRAVRSALSSLPAEQRRALLYAAFYGLTAKEVSELEAIPLGTAKTRIRSGLLKLRRALAGEAQLRLENEAGE